MKRTLLAVAATVATVLATAVPATAADATKESCFANQTLRGACVIVSYDAETGTIKGAASTWAYGTPKVGNVYGLLLQKRTCGGTWQNVFYDTDADGWSGGFDLAGSRSYAARAGTQWRSRAVLSWKVQGYPSTERSTTRWSGVLGSC